MPRYFGRKKTKTLGKWPLLRTQAFSEALSRFCGPFYVCKMEQIFGSGLFQHIRMKMNDLTKKQISSVKCPTCGAGVGRRCELSSGGLRFEPHIDRKLSAGEVVERKRTNVGPSYLASKMRR
jgi:hypothetical protein